MDDFDATRSSIDPDAPAGAEARRAAARRSVRRPRTTVAGGRLQPNVESAGALQWFGARSAGFVCCLEIREAVSLHIRLDLGSDKGERDRTISAYQPFTLTTADAVWTLDPRVREDVDRADLAPLLRLTRRRASEPEWSENGQAVVRLDDGSLLTFPAHPTETSWMIIGRYGQTWSSRPGGRVVEDEDPPTTAML